MNTGKLIPLSNDHHWICNVPRHADLEQIITDLEAKIDEQRRQLADIKHDNRRLERSLAKKSIKVDALDLAASRKRSRSIADSVETESLQVKFFSKKKLINSLFYLLIRMMFMSWNNNFFENNVKLLLHKIN
jgi:23S rRNA A1618 N6-methylase RlmF